MLKNLIVLPDGRELFSGAEGEIALQNVTLTQQVNSGADLTLGAACANMLEATLITPRGELHLQPGTELTLYKVSEAGERTRVGLFTLEKPSRPSPNAYKLTAYDRVSWLDKDLSQWLESLNDWPYTLESFAHMVCAACNLSLVNENLLNGSWQISKFSARGITGRQLMQWVGQLCGSFCRATPEGALELAWYTPKAITLTSQGELPLLSCKAEDYATVPVDKLQLQLTETDVGAIRGTGSNCYTITGNYLLTADDTESLQAVAESLYDRLAPISYTPCTLKLPANTAIAPGDILSVTDANGRTVTAYVMKKVQGSILETLECTGSPNRTGVTATNSAKLTALSGRVLELQMGVEGLRAENREAGGRAAALEMTVDGIRTEVTRQHTDLTDVQTRMTAAEQTAQGLSLTVQTMKNEGVSQVLTATGYSFDARGLTVEKSGREITTRITEDGMQVYKNQAAVLTANSEGVDAVDLHASTYLAVGGRSRFENYGANRTGCFWIGG